jgi:predicted nucleic acid-binding protein
VLVVDTSAVSSALVGRPPDKRLVDRWSADGDLTVARYDHVALADRTWELHNLTAYDATFIALPRSWTCR